MPRTTGAERSTLVGDDVDQRDHVARGVAFGDIGLAAATPNENRAGENHVGLISDDGRQEALHDHGPEQAAFTLPFQGTWRTEMSRARRVPTHGTHLFATTLAVDFVAVHVRRSATTRDWRTAFSTEPPERFFAFGQALLAPACGRVVRIHDG
jgi:hypothetical protein